MISSYSRVAAVFLLIIGLLLVFINVFLYKVNIVEPAVPENEKNKVAGYYSSIRDQSALPVLLVLPLKNFNLEVTNTLLFESLIHSDARRIGFRENWLLWLMGHVHEPFSHTQDPEKIIAGGGGLCSEVTTVLKRIVEVNGLQARFVHLMGHTLLEVKTKDGWRIADPDYGVTYPVGLKALEGKDGAGLISKRLYAKGYRKDEVERYIHAFQTAEDNLVSDTSRQVESPRLYRIEQWAEWLKWLIPILLIGMGGVVLFSPPLCCFIRISRQCKK